MSKITTHLLAEDPSVVLIGKETALKSRLKLLLDAQKMRVEFVSEDEIISKKYDSGLLDSAYKTIWLYEGDKRSGKYLEILEILKKVGSPVVVVAKLLSKIKSFESNFFKEWKDLSDVQLQFVVDCRHHLPEASLIFGLNVIGDNLSKTIIDFATDQVSSGVLAYPEENINFIESDVFVKGLKKYLLRPNKRATILIKGKSKSNSSLIKSIKAIYDSYHNVSLEIISDSVELDSPIPFSFKRYLLNSDLEKIASEIVKKLPPPEKNSGLKIQKPSKEVSTPDISKKDIDKISYPVKPSTLAGKSDLEKETEKEDEGSKKKKEVVGKIAAGKEAGLENDKKSEVSNDPDEEISSDIQKIFKSSRADAEIDRVKKIVKSSEKISKKSKRRKFLFAGGVGMMGMAMGVLILISTFLFSQFLLKQELIGFFSDEGGVELQALSENKKFEFLTNTVDFQVSVYSSLIENSYLERVADVVEVSKDVQAMPKILSEANESSKNLVLQIFGGDVGETDELAQILGNKIHFAYEKLSLIQANLDKVELKTNSNQEEGDRSEFANLLKGLRSNLVVGQQLQPSLPSLVGADSKKTYAVILQNDQELRPTGGFIQAVALLNFDQGSLVSHNVYSADELDRRLHAEVAPPEDLTKYLGEEKWFLRDANWYADFPSSSRQIAWFLDKVLGVEVDGVIGVNLISLGEVVRATGPVDLPEYNEVITHQNLSERMEFHSEVILVDQSNSANYSKVIFESILKKIFSVNKEKIPSLLSSFKRSLDDDQMLISIFEKDGDSIFQNLGWTGAMLEPECPARLNVLDCEVNIVAQVESNIGINKANYFLERQIDHKIAVDREKAVHKRKITYKNTSDTNSWPQGAYKSYQRFYLDENAQIDSVLINGSELIEEQVSQSKKYGLRELGFRVDVPIQKEVVVELLYSVPHEFEGDFAYVFYNKKQSGTQDKSVRIYLEHDRDLKPTLISPSAEVSSNIIDFVNAEKSSLFSVSLK